ncbi:hypothetical protein [Vibrio chagasii]|uniref:hypothetical protein n=1 Tax=Vibrio chagasii TaxID=170679 RepID=UPI003D9FDD0B
MSVLIIANKGSFFIDVQKKLGSEGFIFKDISSFTNLDICNVISSKYTKVVYLGGETRFEDNMDFANYHLPKALFDKAIEHNCSFVYLSSLSVFGWTDLDYVTVDSKRQPLDKYGESKNNFDKYVLSFPDRNVSVLFPASIHSNRGRSSVEKISKVFDKVSLMKSFRFPGVLSFVYRDDLINDIITAIKSDGSIKKICSQDFVVAGLSNKTSVPIPRLPNGIFRFFAFLVGKRKALIVKMLLRGIYYK